MLILSFSIDIVGMLNNLYDLEQKRCCNIISMTKTIDYAGLVCVVLPIYFTIAGTGCCVTFFIADAEGILLFCIALKWDISTSEFGKCARFTLSMIVFQECLKAIRTVALLVVSIDIFKGKLVASMVSSRYLVWKEVKFYKTMQLAFNILRGFAIALGSCALSMAFVGLVVGVNATLIGLRMRNPMVYVSSFGLSLMIIGLLQVGFIANCSVFENSGKILQRWKEHAGYRRDGGFAKRVVRSLRVMSIPACDIGIVDKDIKMNYCDGVLNYILTALMISKEA